MTKITLILRCLRAIGISCVVCCDLATAAFAAQPQIRQEGSVVTISLSKQAGQQGGAIDYAHAQPMPLPSISAPSNAAAPIKPNAAAIDSLLARPGSSPGDPGSGKLKPVVLAPAVSISSGSQPQSVTPLALGTADQPFTTSRVNALADTTSRYYPYRATGKLFFLIGRDTYVCSASLIKKGIVVTSAHCVADFGTNQIYSAWRFVPAYNNGKAPFGVWTVKSITILASYMNGTDSCAVAGIVCTGDVALLTLKPVNKVYVGAKTGYFAYGWDGYGYNSQSQAQISQLGYAEQLDRGLLMERNDSQGYIDPHFSNNTIIGSLLTGGASGGPWLVNLGMQPVLMGTAFGSMSSSNTVVGVTSWGYSDSAVKQQGASLFTSNNIVPLINTACGVTPAAC